jgi:hypothetical protein
VAAFPTCRTVPSWGSPRKTPNRKLMMDDAAARNEGTHSGRCGSITSARELPFTALNLAASGSRWQVFEGASLSTPVTFFGGRSARRPSLSAGKQAKLGRIPPSTADGRSDNCAVRTSPCNVLKFLALALLPALNDHIAAWHVHFYQEGLAPGRLGGAGGVGHFRSILATQPVMPRKHAEFPLELP